MPMLILAWLYAIAAERHVLWEIFPASVADLLQVVRIDRMTVAVTAAGMGIPGVSEGGTYEKAESQREPKSHYEVRNRAAGEC